MPRPIVTNVIPEFAAGGDVTVNLEMPVNPLSSILISVKPLNDTGTLANFVSYFGIMAHILRATLIYRGQSIFSMRGQDIAAYNYLRWGILPEDVNGNRTDDERRACILPIHLGKMPFDAMSCFPATTRGELTLQLQLDDAITGSNGLRIGVDTVELLDAKPKEFERRLEITRTNTATGNNDLDLIPGNWLRNVLLFGTTGFTGAAPAPSWSTVRVLVDNQERFYTGTSWEVLKSMPYLFGRQATMLEHFHGTTTDGNAQTSVTTVGVPFGSQGATLDNYALLDFDVTRDDEFSLDLTKANKVQLRHNAATADAVRAVQTEVIKTADLA